MGSTTPPWRSLDAPPATPSTTGVPAAKASDGPATPMDAAAASSWRPTLAVAAAVAGAITCAVVAIALIVSSGSGAMVVVDGADDGPGSVSGSSPGTGAAAADGTVLVVEIVGAVPRTGVYRLPQGSRIGDLVAAAGGYGPRVDTGRAERELNLAAVLIDGDQVRVPSRDDVPAADGGVAGGGGTGSNGGTGTTGDTGSATGAVDLNSASSAELEALPGIGPVTAQKIITARDEAPFGSIEDLRTRGLVGEKTFEKIRPSIVVH
jgi:competence protein ComEA